MLKKILKEIDTIARTALYFAIVFIILMVMKKLYLKDYNIAFNGVSHALLGALVMSKVVILMEYISLGKWVQRQPAIVDVIFRTLLYTAGVLVVVVLEKAFEKRHEADGFIHAISYVFTNRDIYHVWATIIGSGVSIFVYNSISVVQRVMGKSGLAKLFSRQHSKRQNISWLSKQQPESKNLQFALPEIQVRRSFKTHVFIHTPGILHGHCTVNNQLLMFFLPGFFDAFISQKPADTSSSYQGIYG
jgi:hypothetical protein